MAGLAAAFGSGAMTNSFRELEDADCILVIGSNTTVAHPIGSMRIMRALQNGARLIVVDPRQTQIAQLAHLHVRHNLGTDVALINGMMHVIYQNGWHNQAFIAERTENFEALAAMIEQYPPARVTEITGVPVEVLVQMAEWYAKAEASAICYVLGITQHTCGTDNVKSLANLAMLCGHIGPAVHRGQSHPGPEQRPGGLRHGGAAQRLPRLPVHYGAGKRQEIRSRLEGQAVRHPGAHND